MALAPGEVRKELSADSLFRMLRSQFGSLPDPRSAEVEIPLGDALMSAFAMFSLKDPSLLAFDHRRRDPNDNVVAYSVRMAERAETLSSRHRRCASVVMEMRAGPLRGARPSAPFAPTVRVEPPPRLPIMNRVAV